jgi:hypothetical protein
MGPTHSVIIRDDKGVQIRLMYITVLRPDDIDKVLESIAELAAEYNLPQGYSIEVIPHHIQN